jgi:hypothetical protein
MRATEFIAEAKVSIKDQVLADVDKNGGEANEYFVRFTGMDRVGFSANQIFGRSPDIDNPKFSPTYIGRGVGRPALWFYPLKTYLSDRELYAADKPYVWLVRIKPNAWLQPVTHDTKSKQEAPKGKERVGIIKNIVPPAAIFFKPAFDVVGKYYDYGMMHQRHGEVKGPPKIKPTFFDRVRGHA